MTKRKNMTAAQRQAAVEGKVEQMEMATRMSQMLLQQLGNSSNQMGKDLSELATRQRDVQYRVLALQELLEVKLEDLDLRAEALQVKDFTDASDKEDVEKEYTLTDVVEDDSVVIITTTVDGEASAGILRSKLLLSELAFPKLKEDLLGKHVDDQIEADINGTTHKITILGIRRVPEVVEEPVAEETVAEEPVVQDEQPVEVNG